MLSGAATTGFILVLDPPEGRFTFEKMRRQRSYIYLLATGRFLEAAPAFRILN